MPNEPRWFFDEVTRERTWRAWRAWAWRAWQTERRARQEQETVRIADLISQENTFLQSIAADAFWGAPTTNATNATNAAPQETEAMMTRRDYETIARTLKRSKPNDKTATVGERRMWISIVNDLIEAFAQANPAFDAAKFREALDLQVER
jgi:hypothetical protein